MPAEDPGDVFLRNRGAVLDALLADPALGSSGGGMVADRPASAAAATGNTPDPAVMAAVAASAAEAAADRSGPRRRGGDSSASDRINALLNGQSSDTGSHSGLGSEYAGVPASRLRESADSENSSRSEAPAAAERPSATAGRRGGADQFARDLVTQLRKPKVALAVAAGLAVLLVLMLVVSGGEEQPSQPQVLTQPATTAPEPAPTGPAPGGVIEVRSAVSQCPPGGTDAMDAFSGEPGKAWSCARSYRVDGQIMRIDLGKTYEIESIAIVPGWDHVGTDGVDQWAKYRTVSRVSYQFDDEAATVYTQETLDQRTLVETRIDPPLQASEIVLTVLESNGSSSVNTTAISSVVITGR
ncbi:discoidin domain-containing protein [Nocardia cyriacigeorgica]|uniref:Discoidin domain-containing protein n=1 Tax=Nocardia cyriacigeorgica TaxID=135487 RepID=A0A6P1D506_9NOCA|nr:discoidin domain-containing protein [Nocardia cyriacigeorgica]NEW40655.1 discoidin domain-containing protein [Nocardia cyriacigeorgica]NEW45128.1 discoidin domain-containing protein [Nocardia cyriacigeorgica]NEW51117.1 discoidin domain-containing protein [Nocardia cyriacigeorgica]NEW54300.1 discoidin domain-containing protein [Nocardia cyriacigeorgica]